MENLKELNPEVKGDAIIESVEKFLETQPKTVHSYNLVVAGNLMDVREKEIDGGVGARNIARVALRPKRHSFDLSALVWTHWEAKELHS